MLEFLHNLLGVLGENPNLTPYLLLIIIFVLIAFAAGRAGKMALNNVDVLLKQAEAASKRLEKEIARKDAIIAARDIYIAKLEDDQQTTVDFTMGQRKEMAALHDRIFDLERENRGLLQDYNRALEMLEDMKNDKP